MIKIQEVYNLNQWYIIQTDVWCYESILSVMFKKLSLSNMLYFNCYTNNCCTMLNYY